LLPIGGKYSPTAREDEAESESEQEPQGHDTLQGSRAPTTSLWPPRAVRRHLFGVAPKAPRGLASNLEAAS